MLTELCSHSVPHLVYPAIGRRAVGFPLQSDHLVGSIDHEEATLKGNGVQLETFRKQVNVRGTQLRCYEGDGFAWEVTLVMGSSVFRQRKPLLGDCS